MLAEKYGVAADVWSVTSYKELCKDDALAAERWNLLHPDGETARALRHRAAGGRARRVVVAASDYMKVLPDAIDRWLPRPLHQRSAPTASAAASRARALRDFFEVDAASSCSPR